MTAPLSAEKRLTSWCDKCDHPMEWHTAAHGCAKCTCDVGKNVTRSSEQTEEHCIWSQCCEGCPEWTSGCGEEFTNGEQCDSVADWMKFCPFCGKPIIAEKAT